MKNIPNMPATLVMGALSLKYSSRLVMRFGARATLIPGLVSILASMVVFTQAPVDGGYVLHVLPVMVLLGLGAGTAFPALMNLAMSGVKPQEAGLASGLVNTTVQVGGALGLAVLATLAAGRSDHMRAAGESTKAALTGGYHLAFVVASALVLAAIAVAVTVLKPDAAGAGELAHGEFASDAAYSEAA